MGKKEWKKIRHGIIIFVMAFFSAIPFVVYGKNIDSQETIRIGYIDYGGFIDLDENGEYTGYGVELLDKIAEYTGWKYEYVYDTWDNILKKLEFCYQKAGLVKYDAYNQMGGNLSFCLCMLNERNSGFILNSVHSSDGCYTYTKEIKNGECEIALGEEERKALNMAIGF